MRVAIESLATFILSVPLTLAVRNIAQRLGMVSAPRQDRWHRKPTALLGGVAICVAFLIGYLILATKTPRVYPIIGGATFLFVVGLVDDFVQLKPYTKLVTQLIAAAAVVYFGLKLPWTGHEGLNDLITIFWLIGITNSINLLDNMDGLAGGISFISCAFITASLLLNGQSVGINSLALLGGAVLGFLVFNFPPASIFMGDSGSMFLGFMLGGTALLSEYGRTRNLTAVLLTPVLILLIPIFDAVIVTVTRRLSGRGVAQGGRDHTSHRLVALGMSERQAVLMLYSFAVISGTLALLVQLLNAEVILLLVPLFALVVLFFGIYVGMVRVYETKPPPAESAVIRALVDFSYKRRVLEFLLDVALMASALYGALILRFDGTIPRDQLEIFAQALPLFLVVQMAFFWLFGVYRGLWRYVGLEDLITIGKSVLVGSLVSAALTLGIFAFRGPSRAVLILNPLLLFFLVGGSRLSFRLMRALIVGRNHIAHPEAKRVLIYGAGDGGELLIRELLNNPEYRYAPVGFFDDDARKTGTILHGYRVYGSHQLPGLIEKHGVSEVLISTARVPETNLQSLRDLGFTLRRMSIKIELENYGRDTVPNIAVPIENPESLM
jgi:UDP-GlcNAc:undecaprenyl-phosphate/decaprenyl-phosphate GlcNAc-1-phosphate transferase